MQSTPGFWAPSLVLTGGSLGQGLAAARTLDDMPYLQLLPELRTAPPPGWVKPGVRITYDAVTATIPPPKEGGASGKGFAQVNVGALSAETCVLEIRSYSLAGLAGEAVLLATSHAIGPPGLPADYWLNPDILKKAPGLHPQNIKIAQGPYEAAGKTYNAVRFQYTTGTTENVRVFDLESGLLVFTSSSTPTGAEAKQVSIGTLLGRRDVKIPWADATPPGWLKTIRRMEYKGNITTGLPGCFPTVLPCGLETKVNQRGPTWFQFTQTFALGSWPAYGAVPAGASTMERVATTAQLSGLMIPPAALPQLQAGQEIDKDPHTRVRASVVHVGPAPGGARSVVITESNGVQRLECTYDQADGMLIALTKADIQLFTETSLRLSGKQ